MTKGRNEQRPEALPIVKRVKQISGGGSVSVSIGFIGVSVRYLVTEGHCEVRINYWFRIKTRFTTVKIQSSLRLTGCEEGISAALALADQFKIDEIELCDPDDRVPNTVVANERREFHALKAG